MGFILPFADEEPETQTWPLSKVQQVNDSHFLAQLCLIPEPVFFAMSCCILGFFIPGRLRSFELNGDESDFTNPFLV